jgi:MYXO-CTERM domain-containing protein
MRSNLLGMGLCSAVAAVAVAGSANASTYLTLNQADPLNMSGLISNSASAFTSEFNYQSSGNKVKLWNALGSSSLPPQQAANPGLTYWGPSNAGPGSRPERSFEVSWNNTTGVFSTKVYDTTDFTGTASISLSQTTVSTSFGGSANAGGDFTIRGILQFSAGYQFSGGSFYMRVNGRVQNGTNDLNGINFVLSPSLQNTATASPGTIVLSNMQFNGGNGFVLLDGLAGTYTGASENNYFNLAVVPAPGAVALLGLAGLAGGRRRKA